MLGYSMNVAGNKKGWIFDLRFSNKRAHDYKNKYDGYVYNSRYSESSHSITTGLNRSWGYVHLNLSHFTSSPGIIEGERNDAGNFTTQIVSGDSLIPIAVTGTEYKSYISAVPYQEINHNKAVLNSSIGIHDGSLKTIIGFQQNNRKEFADPFAPDQYGLFFRLNTINYEVKYIFPEMNAYDFSVGINGMWQRSENKGIEFLVPAYDLFDAGIFGIVRKNLGAFDISGGLRFDRRHENIDELFTDSTGHRIAYGQPGSIKKFAMGEENFSGFSASAGATWQASDIVNLKVNIAKGYRSPNIAELGANGIHEGTFRYEIGNRALVPESSLEGDFSIGINTEHVTAEIDIFRNSISNYIFLNAIGNSSGNDSVIDGHKAFTYVQGNAVLAGGELLIDIHPHPLDWLHFENSISYVNGIQKDATDSTKYLPLIPSPKLNTEIRINGKETSEDNYQSILSDRNAYLTSNRTGSIRPLGMKPGRPDIA